MSMTDPSHYRGTWGGDVAPSPIPGIPLDHDHPRSTTYIDENSQPWLIEAYVPGIDEATGPVDAIIKALNANPTAAHWRATPLDPGNSYGEDVRYPVISGSESEYKAVLAVDVYAADWKKKKVPSGGGLLLLVILVALAMSDKRRH